MFKGHPKGLFVAFFANMGERFGFYTMISIFVLFMQAKYGMSAAQAGFMYSTFMVGVYILPLLGGFLADRYLGYGKTISLGLIVMFVGYVLLTLPTAMDTGDSIRLSERRSRAPPHRSSSSCVQLPKWFKRNVVNRVVPPRRTLRID